MKWGTVTAVFLFCIAFWGSEHWRRDLWEPDEARYAYVAREMMQDGHWAVPHRHSEFYSHKPPLYFWLVRGASVLTGRDVDRVTARLPALLAAVATMLLTGSFARRFFDYKAVWPSMLVLATGFLVWHEGGMGRMDSVLLALELAAVYLLLEGDDRKSDGVKAAGYLCLGLGVLAKGPVGFLVPLAVYLSVRYTLGSKAHLGHLLWGIPLALVIPLAWLASAWAEGAPPEYFRELIFKQNIGRVAGTASFGKPRPLYFYLLHVPGEFMPWTLLVPASIAGLLKSGKRQSLKVLSAWAAAVIVFFSLSSGKRNLYVLLAYPALAMLVGGGCSFFGLLGRRWRMVTVLIFTGFLLVLGVAESFAEALLAVAQSFRGEAVEMPVPPALLQPSGLVLLAGTAVMVYLYLRKGLGRAFVLAAAAVFALHLALIANLVFPALNLHKTPVEILEAVRPYAEAGDTMIIYGTTSEIIPLYCKMKSVSAVDPDQLRQRMKDTGGGLVVFRLESWEELSSLYRDIIKIGECTIGHKTMVVGRFGIDRQTR